MSNFDAQEELQKIMYRYAQQQQASLYNGPATQTTTSGASNQNNMIKENSRVVLIKNDYAASQIPEANPIWGKNGEYIAGKVIWIKRDFIRVLWDNGIVNEYLSHDVKLARLEDAPKKKGIFKKVELDTTKLDALIIESGIKSEIVAVLQQHKHSKKIFDDWGLGDVIEYGKGMTMLFWGPPGTGKTFGARCIAKALGKELLVIGAAEIQTSEPGGANRNIQNAFRTAHSENKVLFIDECDSLIANRANLGMILASEINTLLTEIEKSENVIILATNRISDMDTALERRLSIIVEFPEPNEEQRELIWKGLIPKKMPIGKDVNIKELAKKALTGGLIKNAVLQSARLAVSDNSETVGKVHFEKAIERTLKSQGLMGKGRKQMGDDMTVGMGSDLEIRRDIDRFLDA